MALPIAIKTADDHVIEFGRPYWFHRGGNRYTRVTPRYTFRDGVSVVFPNGDADTLPPSQLYRVHPTTGREA
jgi:hypothetical protein